MATTVLNARAVKTLKPRLGARVEVFDGLVPGLALRVSETGHKSWTLYYRTARNRRRLTLGTYPAVSLAGARKKAQRALHATAGGADPAGEKRAARLGETVAELAAEYIERHAKKHKRSWREDQRMLDAEVLPAWKTRKVKDLTRRDVRALVEAIADRGATIAANRYLALVRKMLNFAVQRDWIEANPAALIMKPGAERSRERVLTDEEIRLVWTACETEDVCMRALLRLRLVTAQRGGELVELRWEDVDLGAGWLTLPGTITKNKLPHRVPLSALALEIFTTIPSSAEWVFPGRGGRQPRRDATRGGTRIAERLLVDLQRTDPTMTTFDFHAHDLRRTASTRMAEAGVSQADIAKVLNHVDGGPRATQVYNRYQYDREKRIALDTWAHRLTAILANTPAAVLPFSKGA